MISSRYDLRCFAGAFGVASANILDAWNIRTGWCKPLRRVMPAVAHRRMLDEKIGTAAQHVDFWKGPTVFGAAAVAKVLDIVGAVDCMRDCICEKRAPLAGLCQAFAEKARIACREADWTTTGFEG